MLKKLALAFAVMLAPLAVVACQVPGTDTELVNPTVEGASVQQNAYAVLAAYAEAAEEVAAIVEDPATPEPVKTTLATMSLNVEPVAQTAKQAFEAYDKKMADIQARKDAGETNLDIAFNEAADLYKTATTFWEANKDLLSSFPGLVKKIKS